MKLLTGIIIFTFSYAFVNAKELPGKFEDNLIYLTPSLQDGKVLRIYTDTGGGWNVISQDLVESYKWSIIKKESGSDLVSLVPMPKFLESASIPIGGINNFMEGKLFVAPPSKIDPYAEDYDAFLGGRWHAEKIIQFNYVDQVIIHHEKLPEELSGNKGISLGFQKSKDGTYTTAFPSIDVIIDGDTHKMLFDTGAMAVPKKEFKKKLESNYLRIATSFIVASVFDHWRKEHPEWKVLVGAC